MCDHGDGKLVWFEASVILQANAGGTLIALRPLYARIETCDEVVDQCGDIESGKQHPAKLEAYVRANLISLRIR